MVRKAKVGRGGPRAGTPGTAYSNRSDLNGPGGLPYGQNQQLQQSAQSYASAGQATAPVAAPPQPFNRPTERPNEPVTTGLPFGAGAGPEALGPPPGANGQLLAQLQGAYLRYPNEDLRQLIAQMQMAQR